MSYQTSPSFGSQQAAGNKTRSDLNQGIWSYSMSLNNFNLFSFSGNTKILHLSWLAFFISFFVWFNHAPLLVAIKQTMGLTDEEIKTLLILNVALTIPARIVIGMLVDKYGPKLLFASLLSIGSIPCFMFAMAESFESLALARFLLGGVGAGFVVGIRLISEWYPAKQVGIAEGIYGGWGNFGSAAAAMSLPTIALLYGGADGWRYAVATTGVVSIVYAFIFFKNVSDTPKGSTYFKPKKVTAMEVTTKGDLAFYILMQSPMYVALAVLTWKLSPSGVSLLSDLAAYLIYVGLATLYFYNVSIIYKINIEHLKEPVPDIHRYNFKQVAILDLTYCVTFGSELAVISMLPLFYSNTFDMSPIGAGMLASMFAAINLVARPGGGWLSDKIGRKKSLSILVAGTFGGYFLMSLIGPGWPIFMAVAITMLCSLFVHAGNGAVFAVIPLIRRRMTGQIAGMAGAYGNVGAVTFLTVLSFVSPSTFFFVIACAALGALLAIQFLDEPRGAIAEVLPDGTVQMIEVE